MQSKSAVDLSHSLLRDKQADVLAEGITELEDLEKISLAHNGITDEGMHAILENLTPST